MQDCSVMAAVVEPADLCHAPNGQLVCQVHRDLPAEAGSMLIPAYAAWPELTGDGGIDLLQRRPPDSCVSVSSAHPTPPAAIRRELDQSTNRYRRDRSRPGIRATWFAPPSPPAFLGTCAGGHSRCCRVG